MMNFVDRVVEWLGPRKLPAFMEPQKAKSPEPYRSTFLEDHLNWRRQMWELEAANWRIAQRVELLDRLHAKRNGMIGRLDDCRWRVSVLMASKDLPADYAMRVAARKQGRAA